MLQGACTMLSTLRKRIGILTGGGDVPGLNAAIKSFVTRVEGAGHEAVGLRRGWLSLIQIIPEKGADNTDWVVPLTRASTRTIDRTGGTMLHTTRVNPAMVRSELVPDHLRSEAGAADEGGRVDLTAAARRSLEFLELDALVALGGDGTLSFARRLHREGFPIVAIPKTMDNDVVGTDYCLGFSTAVTRSVMFINDLRTGAGSHERILIVELFGRSSGETCLLSAYLASADRAIISEVPFDTDRLYELLRRDKSDNPSNYAVLAISEGASPIGGTTIESGEADEGGNRKLGGIGGFLADDFERRSHERVIYQRLAYLMRSGSPDSLDQLVANNFASLAADLVLRGRTGTMVAILGGKYDAVPLESLRDGVRRVDVDRFYDRDGYRPNIIDVMGLPMFLH